MHQTTEQNLINAFGGESQANMRYRHFAMQAEQENFSNVARLFQAISHAEFIHAGDHYRELGHLKEGRVANSMAAFGPGKTSRNLELSIMGEEYEITEMYPVFIEIAKFQGESGAQRSFEWSYATEKEHKKLFERAKEAVDSGRDLEIGPIQVCNVCGFTLEGDAPDNCPVCKAKREKFESFS
ncbi:MAG: rubrerythrin family protein [Desulfovibrionales bacterium]